MNLQKKNLQESNLPEEEKKNITVSYRKGKKRKGVSSEVFPFKTDGEIKAMLDVFNKRTESVLPASKWLTERDKLLFIIGINIGIRASDLCCITWNFFYDLKGEFREGYTIQPKKTRNKFVKLFFNNAVKSAVESYVEKFPITCFDDYVFRSQKGSHINERTICDIIKRTAQEAGIKQNIGSHSLRKTFGFHVWHNAKNKDKALVLLQRAFNHSSTVVTLEYIGVTDDEIEELYNTIDLGLE